MPSFSTFLEQSTSRQNVSQGSAHTWLSRNVELRVTDRAGMPNTPRAVCLLLSRCYRWICASYPGLRHFWFSFLSFIYSICCQRCESGEWCTIFCSFWKLLNDSWHPCIAGFTAFSKQHEHFIGVIPSWDFSSLQGENRIWRTLTVVLVQKFWGFFTLPLLRLSIPFFWRTYYLSVLVLQETEWEARNTSLKVYFEINLAFLIHSL